MKYISDNSKEEVFTYTNLLIFTSIFQQLLPVMRRIKKQYIGLILLLITLVMITLYHTWGITGRLASNLDISKAVSVPRSGSQYPLAPRNTVYMKIPPSPLFVVIILSSARNYNLRNTIRTRGWLSKTWLHNGVPVRYTHWFIVGQDPSVDISTEIRREEDMLVWPGPEHYRSIVYKVAWTLGYLQNQGVPLDFLVKLDDDSFINLTNLMGLLDTIPMMTSDWLGGECIVGKAVDRTGKYAVSREDYNSTHYPGYVAGAGYIMSRGMVEKLVKEMWRVPVIPVEDAYVGVLAHLVGVKGMCLPWFYHFPWDMFVDRVGEAVLLHKLGESDIHVVMELATGST